MAKEKTDPQADLQKFAVKIDDNVLASDFSEKSKRKGRQNEAKKSS